MLVLQVPYGSIDDGVPHSLKMRRAPWGRGGLRGASRRLASSAAWLQPRGVGARQTLSRRHAPLFGATPCVNLYVVAESTAMRGVVLARRVLAPGGAPRSPGAPLRGSRRR